MFGAKLSGCRTVRFYLLVPNFPLLTPNCQIVPNCLTILYIIPNNYGDGWRGQRCISSISQKVHILSATPSLCLQCLLNVPSLYKCLITKVLLFVINQLKNTLCNVHLGLKPTRQQTIHIYQVPYRQQCSAVYEQLHRRRIALSVYPMYKTYKTTSLMLTYFLLPLLLHLSILNFLVQICPRCYYSCVWVLSIGYHQDIR